MKASLKALVIAAASLLTTPALAITVATTQDLTSSLATGRYSGVGSLGFLNANGTVSQSCTGSLVSSNVVVTATHCLHSDANFRFVLPAAGDYNLSGGSLYTVKSSAAIQSIYGGDSDLAVLTLNEVVTGHDIYDLYTDQDELGKEVTLVGAGVSGVLEKGFDLSLTDFRLRDASNKYEGTWGDFLKKYYELYGEQAPDGVGLDQLIFDYDSGTEQDDTFGKVFGIHDLGVYHDGKLAEGGIIYGDSGGPDFLQGKIVGVHSSTGSAGFFQLNGANECGKPGSLDRVPPGVWGCSDGSAGDFGVSMRMSYYADAVKSYISAAAVPEPSTWAMMITGFFMIGLTRRRAAKKASGVRLSLG